GILGPYMVTIAEKGPTMPDSSLAAEPLEQIHELNRLFLRSLQTRKAEGLCGACFPPGAVAPLRRASSEQLDAIADFPRALFELMIDAPPSGSSAPLHGGAPDTPSVTSRILEL